jgi:hypothetical protein
MKSLTETSLQLILSTKESSGHIKNLQWHKIIDQNCDLLIQLIHTIKEQSSTKNAAEHIRKLISTLDTTIITNQGHFTDHQNRMIDILKQMTIQDRNNSDHSRQLIREYNELINSTYGAIGTAITNELAINIKNAVRELGLILIDKLGQNYSKYDLENLSQKVILTFVLLINQILIL